MNVSTLLSMMWRFLSLLSSTTQAFSTSRRRGGGAVMMFNLKKKGSQSTAVSQKSGMCSLLCKELKSTAQDSSSLESKPMIPKKFVPFPFQYQEELILKVESLTNTGIGVCRTKLPQPVISTDHESYEKSFDNETKLWVVMVPNTIPGELVRVKIYRNFGSYSDADLVEILETSPSRVQPPCPLFQKCGGCQYQHMDITVQRQWKTAHVQELLERIGKLHPDSFPPTRPTIGTQEVYHYRSKITPHYDSPIKNDSGEMEIQAIGFKQQSNRNLIDVPYCHIATERINNKLTEYRKYKFQEALEGKLQRPKKGATLLLRDALKYDETDLIKEEPTVETDPNVYVKTKVKNLTFRFLAGNFFQNNPYMLPVMVDHVIDASVKPNAKGENMTHLIDCYCGSGLFCLSAAEHFNVCVGIEVNEKAVEEARLNAKINDILNCKFVAASAEAIFMSKEPVEFMIDSINLDEHSPLPSSILVQDFPRERTAIVIDPPRKGCSEEFLQQLFAFCPERCVYMSCDPATQARDARDICAAGYNIISVQPFDLFPQTRHIECLIVFERKSHT